MANTDNNQSNNNHVVGLVNWGYTPPGSHKEYNREELPRIQFMKFNKGANIFRIITPMPAVFFEARIKIPGSKSHFGDRIRTAFPTYDDCPVKKYWGAEGRARFSAIVLCKETKDLRIWDFSQNIEKDLRTTLENELSQRDDGVEPFTICDMNFSIAFDPKSTTPSGFYKVLGQHPKPLTPAEQKVIDDVGGVDILNKILVQHTRCSKPETVLKQLEKKGWKVGMPTSEDAVPVGEEGEITEGPSETIDDPDMKF
jgi:hypothetical protein